MLIKAQDRLPKAQSFEPVWCWVQQTSRQHGGWKLVEMPQNASKNQTHPSAQLNGPLLGP